MKINQVSDKTADEIFQLLLNIATSAYALSFLSPKGGEKDELAAGLGQTIALDNDMLIEHLFGDDTARVISKEAARTILKLTGEDVDDDIPPFSLN